MGYRQVLVIGSRGSGPEQFAEALCGITVDQAGLLYAVGDGEVKVFDAQGKLQRRWPTERPGYCVAVDGQGAVYVGEVGQVEKFDSAGKRSAVWRDGERLGVVTAIGFFGEFVLIADAKDRCIRRYDDQGRWLNNVGKDNKTRGFLIPNGHLDFSVDQQGIIHAANPGKHRVERYSIEGELLGHFGRFGTRRAEDFPGCCNPTNLTLGPGGRIVVTEKAGPRVKVYDADGKLLAVVAAEEFDANCKNMDVGTDDQGRIYVVDTVGLSIHVFAPVDADIAADEAPKATAEQGVR
jgi:sugar lactone lactonase YvrE